VPRPEESGPATDTPASTLAADLQAAAKYLPDHLLAVVALDLKSAFCQLTRLMPMGSLVNVTDNKEMNEELAGFIRSRVGFDPFAIESVLIFVTAHQFAGALVKGDIRLQEAQETKFKEMGGIKVMKYKREPRFYMIELEGYGVAVFEDDDAVEKFAETVMKRKDDEPPEVPKLVKLLTAREGIVMSAIVDTGNALLTLAWGQGIPTIPAPNRISLFVTGNEMIVVIDGTKECLDAFMTTIETYKAQAMQLIAAQKSQLESLDLWRGIAIILGDHLAGRTFEAFMPKREGSTLEFRLPIEQWGTLSMLGTLSAVAIPAFMKYQKKAKKSEAIEELRRLQTAATVYFCTPHVDKEANMLPPHFPPAQTVTPSQGTCCLELGGPDKDSDGQCDPNPGIWDTETWNSLLFSVDHPHRFVYAFESNGKTGNEAEFTASAYGDLDCDGIRSTFQVIGRGKVENGECDVESSAVIIHNELE